MRRNAVEWFVLAASLLTIVGLLGVLAYQAIGFADHPPVIEVVAERERGTDTELGWQLPVEVRNTGDQTAAAVAIEVVGTVAGAEEIASIDVDLLAGGGSAVRVVAFSAEPAEVRFRLVGFTVP